MLMKILVLALAPVFIILIYIYLRDKYEKEPIGLLLKSILAGAIIVLPVIFAEQLISAVNPFNGKLLNAAWSAFAVAAFTEELFKFAALWFLIWKNPNLNEPFDGIVYAVFISLGFAGVENVLYVSQGGLEVAVSRAITAVPAHALFGVRMGYYFGIASMYPELRSRYLRLALWIPVLLHGIYDFILFVEVEILLLVFAGYMIYLYYAGFKQMKVVSDASVFKNVPGEEKAVRDE
jgi:RsiW-degrading membrane proteinase PrsW (M82 family)